MTTKRRFASLLLAACASACASAPVRTAGPAPTAAPTLPDPVHWVRNAAEYRAAALQAFRLATHLVEEQARGRPEGSWGVISDADETLIDNSDYQKERAALGLPFTPESWRQWCARRAARPLPGAVAFAARLRALGGRLAIVTNRTHEECPDTEANLRAIGLAFDALLCRGADSDKQPRFELVTSGRAAPGLGPLDVVLYVGDNIRDFPDLGQDARDHPEKLADFGRRFVVVPNPMYGSWERNPRQ